MIPDEIRSNLAYVHKMKDRSDPVAFVGRRAELVFLQDVVDVVRATPASGHGKHKGSLRLIHGVPGAGKTALKAEFMRQCADRSERLDPKALAQDADRAYETPTAPPLLCVELDNSDLAQTPLSLVRSITEEVVKSQTKWQAAQLPYIKVDAGTLRDAVSRRLFRGATWKEVRDGAHGLQADSTLVKCINAYAENVWHPGTTVVLIIDEAQNLYTDDKKTKSNMQRLFEGNHDARLPVLCFGLSNSGKVLNKLGLSRPTGQSDRPVGCLNPGEGRQAIVETMRKVGLSTEIKEWRDHLRSIGMTKEAWETWSAKTADVLAEQSADFPQHVAAAHIALCGNLLEDENSPFDQTRRNNIAAGHQVLKQEYYEVRLHSADLNEHQVALGAICDMFRRTQNAPMRRRVALNLLKMGDDDGDAPSGHKAKKVLKAAVDKGIIAPAPKGGTAKLHPPPIPSLQSYLVDVFKQELQENPMPAFQEMRALLDKTAPLPEAEQCNPDGNAEWAEPDEDSTPTP